MRLTHSKQAYKRLEESGRRCDGCGVRIGRWTSKCHYDAEHDRVYCSVGGCAEKVRSAPKCAQCRKRTNPFLNPVGIQVGGRIFCRDCMESFCGDDALAGLERVDVESVPGLTPEQRRAAAEGPYVVVRKGSQVQVVQPLPGGALFVRSAGISERRAVELCAKFNTTAT